MKCNLHSSDKSKGVYYIINNLNKDKYIGSTINTFYNRYRNHKSSLLRNKHHSNILQNAVNKYGFDNFIFKPIKYMKDDDQIIETEAILLEILKPKYNIAMKVRHGGKPNLGRKLSKEWKENIAKSVAGYKHSKEVKQVVTKNNRKNACNCKFTKDNKELYFNSWVEAAEYFNTNPPCFWQAIEKYNGFYKGWKVERLSKQSKSVRLYEEDSIKEFNSMAACDRYLDMWRGATSNAILKGSKICGYNVEKIR